MIVEWPGIEFVLCSDYSTQYCIMHMHICAIHIICACYSAMNSYSDCFQCLIHHVFKKTVDIPALLSLL